jgi:streptogramin lyase
MATKVEPRICWKSPGQQPNGLQATPEGLWVIDQIDPNDIYLLRYEDGEALRKIPTRAVHSSGITIDPDGHIWIASTFTYEVICFDRDSGRELKAFPTPPYDRTGGPHGMEWRADRLWFNVPIARQVFAMDPANGKILHSIPLSGDRSHGIAWDPSDGSLWSVDSNRRVIYKLHPETGQILDAVGCSGPEPHGMTIWQGEFWLCDADTRDVYTVPVPHATAAGLSMGTPMAEPYSVHEPS